MQPNQIDKQTDVESESAAAACIRQSYRRHRRRRRRLVADVFIAAFCTL